MEKISIHTESIRPDQFLKWAGVIESGGQVRLMLEDGLIIVNDRIETARRRRLSAGDVVEIKGAGCWQVAAEKNGDAGNEGRNP